VIIDNEDIRRELERKYKSIVAREHKQEMTRDDFLDKYKIELEEGENTEWMAEEIAENEIDKNSAPGPSGQMRYWSTLPKG
jgi:hypothetical protein